MPAILCIAAHPDDEAFGPAGTIARYAAAGVPADLLTLTRGQRGTQSPFADSPEALGLLREYETRASAAVLDMRKVTILDYVDGDLDKADIDELASHILTRDRSRRRRYADRYGPARHHPPRRSHRRPPRDDARRRAEHRDLRIFYVAVEGEWAIQMNITGPEAEPTHRIDISCFFERKLAALACHSSQEDSREFFAMLSKRGQQFESFHRALPPYDGAEPAYDLFA